MQQDGQSAVKYGGTGLGLAITTRLVEMMGGRITVQSKKGGGSIFEVSLKNVSAAAAVPESDEEQGVDVGAVRFEKATILVTDNSRLNRQLLVEYLASRDFEIIEAVNGKEALDMVKQYRPDLVLMDLKMPVMDGKEATRIVKGNDLYKDIPIIIITASVLKSQIPEVKKAGAEGFLEKPICRRVLINELMRFLPHTVHDVESSPAENGDLFEDIFNGVFITKEVRTRLPGLISVMKNELTKWWKDISTTYILDEIEDFSNELEILGRNFQINMLSNWGRRLADCIQTYDIVRIGKILDSFPLLIEKMEEALQEENSE